MKKIIIAILCGVVVCAGVIVACLIGGDKLLIAPTEEYIIQCLEKVPGITEIEAVKESTDPMKNLNKPGWYTAHVYFSYSLINQEEVYGKNLIDKGTNAGGSVEVYQTKSDAKKRNEYLAMFDGGALSSGSHIVVGTVVVRTSDELTASQQIFLENNIIFALKGEEEKIIPLNPRNDFSEDRALQELQNIIEEYITEYPEDYITPLYLKDCLIDKGFSQDVSSSVIKKCNVDWGEQANIYISNYLTFTEEFGLHASWISESDLREMLEGDEFANTTIESALEKIDWEKTEKDYMQHLSSFYESWSRIDAKSMLDGIFTSSKIEYLIENSDIDWKSHALNKANELYIEYYSSGYYDDDTIDSILSDIVEEMYFIWEYTYTEVVYAIENMMI